MANEMTFRWQGQTRNGNHQMGQDTLSAEEFAQWVRGCYQKGWRSLRAVQGTGPVPPPKDSDRIAAIEPDPETGRRGYWIDTSVGRNA